MSLPRLGIGKTGTGPGGKVADYTLNRLEKWGIKRIFGYPGDGINGFLGAFDRAKGDPEFIQVRHEEMAAFMASAHAKFTRRRTTLGNHGEVPFGKGYRVQRQTH
jgi:glyoxylate carboligase